MDLPLSYRNYTHAIFQLKILLSISKYCMEHDLLSSNKRILVCPDQKASLIRLLLLSPRAYLHGLVFRNTIDGDMSVRRPAGNANIIQDNFKTLIALFDDS